MKKILITGGAGFIGAHFIEHILKNTDWAIVCADRLDHSGNLNRLADIEGWENYKHRIVTRYHDFRAEMNSSVAQMLLEYRQDPITQQIKYSPFDYIVHFAAGSHVDRSIVDPLSFVQDNVIGTANLLDAMRTYPLLKDKSEGGRMIYFSTDEVFGPAPEGVNYKEWDRFNPNNPYAATKAAAEDITIAYAHTYQMPIMITHCMNVFGERQHPEKFVPMCIKKVLNDETITIHSNKEKTKAGTRFYLHARNVCDAVMFLLEKGKCLDGSGHQGKYNIVGDKEVSNLEMAQTIADLLGKELKYEMVDFHSSRPGHDLRYGLDGTHLREAGWIAPVGFEESMKKMVDWTLGHKEKWLM